MARSAPPDCTADFRKCIAVVYASGSLPKTSVSDAIQESSTGLPAGNAQGVAMYRWSWGSARKFVLQ